MMRSVGATVLLSMALAAAQAPNAAEHRLTVRVKNASKHKGTVRVAIYGSEGDFLKKPLRSQTTEVKGSDAVLTFDRVPAGEYAVAAYQDVNGNAKLDRNFIGIPKEPVGVSNGAKGRFGPPKWKDAKFRFDGDVEKEIVLE